MPLTKLQEYSPDVTLGLWEITESLEEIMSQQEVFPEDEVLASEIHHPIKRLEFWTGRLLVYTVCQRLGIPFHGIHRDENGKPHLKDQPQVNISLSHSHPLVGMVVNWKSSAGIDIERPSAKQEKIAPKFLNAQEQEWCKGHLDRFSIFWSAKEVLYKIYGKRGLQFNEHLELKAADQAGTLIGKIRFRDTKEDYTIQVIPHESFYICFNR